MRTMLSGMVIVVTGGAGLIGRGFVRCIAEHGGIAVVADLNKGASNSLFEELQKDRLQGNVVIVELDITSKESITAAIAYLHDKYGKIDALVNNAYPRNKNFGRKFEDVSYDDFCQNVSSHLGGYFLASQQFASYFKKQGHGTIINMASIYGVVAPRFNVYERTAMTMPVEYAAIKSAIIHLTKYLAQYLKGSNVQVNAISPGGILDGQPDEFLSRYNNFAASKGMLDADDLQGALLFLLSDMSKFINGQNIIIDDGWSL
ncbi:MAG: SDR family oxidoreductase [Sulfuricella sp.]|nr:SDR family oxidoreductase [Sulfuricella sp.]